MISDTKLRIKERGEIQSNERERENKNTEMEKIKSIVKQNQINSIYDI